MSAQRWFALVALSVCALACNKGKNNGPAFPFERAEHLTFTCFGALASNPKAFETLPNHCCRLLDPASNVQTGPNAPTRDADGTPIVPPECTFARNELIAQPALMHALVTQSTRGEVAAVDLVNNKVLDSDRLTPGFTFLDTGGLPSAIVSPETQPRIVQPEGRPAITAGPQWTYIASAEEFQIRALATCRFRSGGACGPDLLPENSDSNYEQRTRVPMDGAPRDMLLGPGPTGPDQALFVTLPDLGSIRRIELAETPTTPAVNPLPGAPLDVVRAVDPFAVEGSDAARTPKQPLWFGVPVPTNFTPPPAVHEDMLYTAACGLGIGHDLRESRLDLPLAPTDPPSDKVQPDKMRYDAESGLLLVSDRGSPVLHAFRFASDGTLIAQPALPTGAIVRDFVITPRVPTAAVTLTDDLAPPEDPNAETRRYLYAIDARGFLMVFAYLQDAATQAVTLQPLLSEQPGTHWADRIDVSGPVTALDVIDTRPQSNWVCGEQDLASLDAQRTAVRAEPQGTARTNQLGQLEARITIYDNADSTYIRGVFVAAASANGTLSLIDIHDLDLSCRARKFCCAQSKCDATNATDLQTPRDSSALDSIALRRHAVRRSIAGQLQTIVSNTDVIDTSYQCREDLGPVYFNVDQGGVCQPFDTFYDVSDTWAVTYHGSIPNTQTTGAALRALDTPPSASCTCVDGTNCCMEVLAPVDMNFCDLGVQPLVDGTAPGDLVAVLGDPPKRLQSHCGKPSSDTASVFEVVEAFADRLIVRMPDPTLDRQAIPKTITEVMDCYPDYIGVELRTGGFQVVGASAPYLHPITTAPDGHCVVDPTKDPLLVSRPVPVENPIKNPNTAYRFKNTYLEFSMRASDVTDPSLRNTGLQTRNGSVGLAVTSIPAGNQTTDALPASVRYEPQAGALFLLDTASQGLRRYLLQPFEYDTNSFE